MGDKAFFYQPEAAPPFETLPAPELPDCVWRVDDAQTPPRPKYAPTELPQSFEIDESLFELPPESPELAWSHDEAHYPPPKPPRFAQDQSQIEEDLYGTIDLHPGYWQDTNVPVPAKPKTLPTPESTAVLLDDLYTEPPPHCLDFEDRPPAKRSKFWDWVAIATVEAVAEFPGYVRLYADTLRYYLTGANADGGEQSAQADSLGGYRSSTEAEHGAYLLLSTIPGLTVEYASRANGDDGRAGSLVATSANRVAYAAPGGSLGPGVSLTTGETYTVQDGSDGSKFVRVTRTAVDNLLGVASIEYTDQYGNVVSMSDADNTESTGGGDRYRAVMIRNASFATASLLRLYLKTLGTTTQGDALPSSGAGALSVAQGFCDWPHQGWCRIVDGSGTLREIVYYSSRTNSVLTVPALGRGRLGTSETAGSAADELVAVPGVRIAWELADPAVNGDVQTIADEETAPTGLTWSTATTPAGGIAVAELNSDQQGALWIHRELPAGVSAFSEHQTQIEVQYECEGETYTETLGGLFRVAVTTSRRLELHIGVGSLPDLDADPDDTETVAPGTTPEEHLASSPWTTAAELTDDAVNFVAVNFRNEYGLRSEELLTTTITLSSGAVVADPPSAPVIQAFDPAASGAFRVQAVYFWSRDAEAQRADQWLIYLTSDGSTPDPDLDAPTVVALTLSGDGAAVLDWTSGTFANGTVGKVLVRTRRSADTSDSASSDVLTATAATAGPADVTGGLFYRKQAEA